MKSYPEPSIIVLQRGVTLGWTEDRTVGIAGAVFGARGPVGIWCHTHFGADPSSWIRCQTIAVEGDRLWLQLSEKSSDGLFETVGVSAERRRVRVRGVWN